MIFAIFTGVVAVFDSVMKAGAKSILLTVEEVGPLDSSAMAYERSIYEFKKENGESFDKGKYVVYIIRPCT